ncbi:Uncharacterised protein [uncultured archaeon]|nr:Uncharacterised protein [uncultured archaeon]
MKNKIVVIIVICMLFLTLLCSGCEQFLNKPDHIKVNVMVAVFINVVDQNYTPVNISLDGAEVTIQILKNGNNYFVYKRIVQNNLCQVSDNLQLSKGDSIECVATFQKEYKNCYPVTNGSATLIWETASNAINFGELYNWYPHITIIMMQDSAK